VSFDPFGDFATEGYLRNVEKEKDLDIVKRLEHASFTTGLDEAFTALGKSRQFAYSDVLQTHWHPFQCGLSVGWTRSPLDCSDAVCPQGTRHFANPPKSTCREFALRKAREKDYLRAHPGEIMGYLAFGHPFLDGNGRTIVTLFSALAQRAGFSVDWSATDKDAYLDALTKEIEAPSRGHLDNYLGKFIREPIAHEELAAQVTKAPGLDGRTPAGDDNEVIGNVDAPEVKAQYEAMLLKRGKKH
jgi:cell filamentation protein